MIYVRKKGEVSWDIPTDSLPTVQELQHWDRRPKFVSLQRARDGWAWYTSNIGRFLPDYRDIAVEGEEERLPYLGNSDFWPGKTFQELIKLRKRKPKHRNNRCFHPNFSSNKQNQGCRMLLQGEYPVALKGNFAFLLLPPPTEPPPETMQITGSAQRADEGHISPSMETTGDAFPSRGGGTSFNAPVVIRN